MRLHEALEPYKHHLFRWPDPRTGTERLWTHQEIQDYCQDGMKAEAMRKASKVYFLDRDGNPITDRRPCPIVIMARTNGGPHRHHELRTTVAPESVVERLVDQARRLWRRSLQSEERR